MNPRLVGAGVRRASTRRRPRSSRVRTRTTTTTRSDRDDMGALSIPNTGAGRNRRVEHGQTSKGRRAQSAKRKAQAQSPTPKAQSLECTSAADSCRLDHGLLSLRRRRSHRAERRSGSRRRAGRRGAPRPETVDAAVRAVSAASARHRRRRRPASARSRLASAAQAVRLRRLLVRTHEAVQGSLDRSRCGGDSPRSTTRLSSGRPSSAADARSSVCVPRSRVRRDRLPRRRLRRVCRDQPRRAADEDALIDRHGDTIALLLRGERHALSRQERDEVLRHRLSYLSDDLVVPTWNAAFVYDTEAGAQAALEILEFANSQLLEFRYYDDLLDRS